MCREKYEIPGILSTGITFVVSSGATDLVLRLQHIQPPDQEILDMSILLSNYQYFMNILIILH